MSKRWLPPFSGLHRERLPPLRERRGATPLVLVSGLESAALSRPNWSRVRHRWPPWVLTCSQALVVSSVVSSWKSATISPYASPMRRPTSRISHSASWWMGVRAAQAAATSPRLM